MKMDKIIKTGCGFAGWWGLGRRFPLFPEEILTKQGNVFIRLPRLFQLYLIRKLPLQMQKKSKTRVKLQFELSSSKFGYISYPKLSILHKRLLVS